MRRILLLASVTLVWALTMGCTANDRDYFRNHIVVLPGKDRPLLIAAKPAGAQAPGGTIAPP